MLLDEYGVRAAAMAYVAECRDASGGVVTRPQLESFKYEGEALKLIDASRGIRNPRQLRATLSVLSQPRGPYSDHMTDTGMLRYAYRSGRPDAGDNRKLRMAVELRLPMILLVGSASLPAGVFVPVLPVYAVRDDPARGFVELALDEALLFASAVGPSADLRVYAERITRTRLHQPLFRAEVLSAYAWSCTVCRLQYGDLLDAAHIRDDASGGQPEITNGLAMCKIHHAAYDRGILGIRSDYVIEVRADVLAVEDGPMLKHGIQEVDGQRLVLPTRRRDLPDQDALAERHASFLTRRVSTI